jgi:hypothetical protein
MLELSSFLELISNNLEEIWLVDTFKKRYIFLIVATQFLTHVLINFQKNPKIAKNNENPKNTFLYIYLHRF